MTREEVKEIIFRHSPCKVYKDSTLESFTKAQLIELLKVAEHNWACEMAGNDQLRENVKDWKPVCHAYWIKDKRHPTMEHCSCCGYEPEDNPVINTYDNTWLTRSFSHCPNCGCAMDWED